MKGLFYIQNKPGQIDRANRFGGDDNFAYTYFEILMNKLKDCAGEKTGFWFNRSYILWHARNLTIVVDESNNVVAFYVISPENEIIFLQCFEPGRGIGKAIIQHERFNGRNGELFVTSAVADSVGFWERMNISYQKIV